MSTKGRQNSVFTSADGINASSAYGYSTVSSVTLIILFHDM